MNNSLYVAVFKKRARITLFSGAVKEIVGDRIPMLRRYVRILPSNDSSSKHFGAWVKNL